ncbi:MAG: 4-hydroxythreonine-4-phosphate dehydrogenase PdxA [Spirochaetia bacterium]|nr:4-hydroxythreonine-4-phosphate dehydrogenase PdxA [Spirochaetia bacterium]MCF7945512.1 4-hydroxythreonine-4-phosphate dehydrogenase PdxA [Spirochaetia bacterium]MCF7946811.1 4-hydroxythreonine-4-phosphate dehydrogenase PdxA [Spirochaetia bacterium]
MGDPAGIGPEILIKAASDPQMRDSCHMIAIADPFVLGQANKLLGKPIELVTISSCNSEYLESLSENQLAVYPSGSRIKQPVSYGQVRGEYGKAAYDSIIAAIDLAISKEIDGVVTNPINKESLRASGVEHAGHTEIFADRTGTKNVTMMLSHGPIRVVHVSTHISLREACDWVKKPRVLEVIKLAYQAVVSLDAHPKPIAVAGLNPHAGEKGLFGDEEIQQIIPAIEEASLMGINVVGPLPPDTVFSRAVGGEFSCVVAMYHDQGHIPVKMAGFQVDPETGTFKEISGVNITLGLPIIRTSVDHGTAFDLAGTGKASEASLKQALFYAVGLYSRN